MNHQEQIQPQWKLIIGFALALLITVGSLLSGSGAIGISGSIIALILVTAIAFINIHNTQSNLGAPISQVKHLVDEISMGNFSNASENTGSKNNSLASKLQALAYSQQERQNEIEASQASTQRIISALNVCNTNVMMADDDYNIVYMNDSVKEMMQSAEADLKVVLPNFNAQALMGESIDVFHKNPAHQRSMLEGLQTQYNGKIQVGTRTFSLIATPIFDDEHQRLGTVVEWDDQTAQLAKEQAEAQLAADNTRIKLALDVCSTNVMMADAEFNIIYMNESVQEMMKTAESDLKAELSRFDADNLIGNNIDIFHKNPAHQRSMLEKLTSTYQTNITVGPRTFNLIATPIFSEAKERIGTVVEWNDRTEALAQETKAKQLSEENAGIRLALDVCNTNVMMADNNYNINYMNKAVQDMMRIAEADLRKVLPNFDANNLVGNNIDVFHKNPAHQRSMLERLTSTYQTEIKVGVRTFGLTATPIYGEDQTRLGTVVEWSDRTDEVALEGEINSLINAANDGDLRQRIDLTGKSGFFENLSNGLNSLMDKTSEFVSEVGVIFEAMSEGDLTKSIENNYKGELLAIKNNANNSVTKLSEVLTRIQIASETVRTSSQEVAEGSDDLSRRTESQASSLEETASSMEQITATVKQTSENASESNAMASDAKRKAEQGGEVVQGAVGAMREIMESSNKINDIIGVIDEIAFQTNLLALNAAVEAARAGEQGRGFAVVAGEVRTLSQRSAAAAKEIKDLIRDSVNKVESGSAMVNQSGQMLNDIVQSVDRVAKMINDVNTAAIEQNSGISQINQAVAQMDEMTQQNAALVEQTSAASRSMSEEASNMNRLIAFFRLDASQSSHSSSPSFASAPSTPAASYSAPEPTEEPVITYQASSAAQEDNGAASFSEDDEWEDF
jgi:methyl-accepting chemotaxis protein